MNEQGTARSQAIRRRYINPFRTHYEKYPSIIWTITSIILLIEMFMPHEPVVFIFILLVISVGSCVPWYIGWQNLQATMSIMRDKKITIIPMSQALIEFATPDGKTPRTFLGWGFDWGLEEAQLAREVAQTDPSKLVQHYDPESPGEQWIHGVGLNEAPIYLPVVDEHTAIVAMTRWGKTVALRELAMQALQRGETLIVIDPKGDHDLLESVRQACAANKRELLVFDTAKPATSVRLDPMRNFDDPTELAARPAALLGRSGNDQNFTGFAFMMLTNIVNGMLLADQRPTLIAIKRYLDGSLDQLLVDAMLVYFGRIFSPGWESKLDPYRRAVAGARKVKQDGDAPLALTAAEEAEAIIAFYTTHVQGTIYGNAEMEGLISAVRHPAEHRQKMLTSLMPILTKLTSGAMARLLSTDITDPDDNRVRTDLRRVVDNRQALYIGLNSLANEDVATAIAEIIAADLAAVCGSLYNYANRKTVVSIFIDEAAEVLNASVIKLLNKGGGQGFRLTLFMQTIADIEAKLGSKAMADKVIGNVANFIFGRVTAPETQKFFCDRLPRVPIKSLSYSRQLSTSTAASAAYSAGQGETLAIQMEPPLEPAILGSLPKLHFFALIGSRLVKGRIPVVVPDSKHK